MTRDSLDEWGRLRSRVDAAEQRVASLGPPIPSRLEAYIEATKELDAAENALDVFDQQFWTDPGPIFRPYGTGIFDGELTLSDDELRCRLRSSELPEPIVRHLERRMERREFNYGLEAIRQFPESIEGIKRLFSRASSVTGLTAAELLWRTDFHFHDLGLDRLDAVFSELRAVVFLDERGFAGVELLAAINEQPQADLLATMGSECHAFDVVTSHHSVRTTVENLAEFIARKYREKAEQLRATVERHGCVRCGLMVVVNSAAATIFGDRDSFMRAACEGRQSVGCPANTHFVVVTGMVREISQSGSHAEVISDDVVVPPFLE